LLQLKIFVGINLILNQTRPVSKLFKTGVYGCLTKKGSENTTMSRKSYPKVGTKVFFN
jgi:hypothetical protein